MEKIIDKEERIRKAEELYARRQLQNELRKKTSDRTDYKRKKPIKRLLIQILICISIYSIYYTTKNISDIFPQDWTYKISDVLEQNINFQKVVNSLKKDSELNEMTEKKILVEELSKMEKDALYIKNNFSIIKPLDGEITSRFGLRNSDNPAVTKDHTGIDIAGDEGTVIVSAIDGVVELVSSEGDLRKSH